jgi:hypothetical protein
MRKMNSSDCKMERTAYLWGVVRAHFGPKNFISRIKTIQKEKTSEFQEGE